DYDGKKVSGDRDPSSELPMHIEIYRNRPDVNAVVHAHPPTATGFAVAGIPLTRAVLAEVVTTLGSIPIAEYGTPSTAELPEAVRKYIKAHDGMLLANHGAVTCGNSVLNAHFKMETIEHFAKISLVARLLGREHLLSREEVERLQGLRGMYGIASPAPVCADPAEAGLDQALCQVLEAPASSTERLVPDVTSALRQASRDGEIRLTYGTHRRRGQKSQRLTVAGSATPQFGALRDPAHVRRAGPAEPRWPCEADPPGATPWVRRWEWSKPRGWSP